MSFLHSAILFHEHHPRSEWQLLNLTIAMNERDGADADVVDAEL